MAERELNIVGVDPVEFFGINNDKLNLLKDHFLDLKITSRGTILKASGDDELLQEFELKVDQIVQIIERFGKITNDQIDNILSIEIHPEGGQAKNVEDVILYGPHNLVIRAKSPNQRKMIDQSDANDLMFAIGPAGTGKTYTAVALAVKALKNRVVKKIILTRPAVEAGESLGFLPGDLKEKVDPYLRPLYDALDDMISPDKLNQYLENRTIEIAPLAFMRGRTLNNAFIILDEAQNATEVQMKMFLTRLGPISRCIVTGDLTQIDLPKKNDSGLKRCLQILKDIDGIGVVKLDKRDVIRHKLVKDIIHAYEQDSDTD